MFPPSQGLSLDIDAISGICGSISVACWVVVFSPQIIENFTRGSADGLSMVFLIVWLAGDVFNILGAVLQGVLPTMVILAVYYTFADIVLVGQCFYYRGFTLKDRIDSSISVASHEVDGPTESSALLGNGGSPRRPRRLSSTSFITSVDGTHLSPATPLLDPQLSSSPSVPTQHKPTTALQAFAFNIVAVLLVCSAGVFGWWVSSGTQQQQKKKTDGGDDILHFNTLGQIFGYLCAILYLGSRIPQILLNYKRKSTEGVAMLFFLFACIGNLTYVLSIFAYKPQCRAKVCSPGEAPGIYARYILVNLSWLLGSLGTLLLDLVIFGQFFRYRDGAAGNDSSSSSIIGDGENGFCSREP
ncbi:MAG: hypothetical protein M1840_007318 [Geoglossum simile]|nr:MAG: hypothetical protein M1840_007318 [Geoglossum simile]